MRVVLAATALLVLLAGCAASTAPAQPPPPTVPTALSDTAASAPTAVTFPAAGVSRTAVSPTGVDARGQVEVPPLDRPGDIAYIDWSARMLTEGAPVVLLAHVSGRGPDGSSVPGAFSRLRDAAAGDEITVDARDGQQTRYRVTDVRAVSKDRFPTAEIYAPSPARSLRVVTCGGVYDPAARSFEENVVVFADAVS